MMGTVKITTADGKDAPEHVKARILAEMELEPKDRRMKFVPGRGEHRILTAAESSKIQEKPAPGSIEAKIDARFEAMAKGRLLKGIQGELLRDEQVRVTGVQLQSEPACRVLFQYIESDKLPPPFPHRIQTFMETAGATTGEPNHELIIHSARISNSPLADAAFDPCPLLKEGSFARGVLKTDGSRYFPERADQLLYQKFCQERRRQYGQSGESDK